jgi:uncharacterized membrane protein (UPF0127 family)
MGLALAARTALAVAGAFAASGAVAVAAVAATAPEPLSAFPQSLLAIRTAAGSVINFKIWTADRLSREEQGLMFVREMDDHAGMLFVFPGGGRITMWMKNTYIPLDMVFTDANGRIVGIAARTTPLSESIISAPESAHAVLELNGGICEKLGIKVGDLVVHQSFGKAKPESR